VASVFVVRARIGGGGRVLVMLVCVRLRVSVVHPVGYRT
jgi:hypothetical protein